MIQDAAAALHQFEMKTAKRQQPLRAIDPPDLPREPLEELRLDRIDRDSYELVAIGGASLSDQSASLRFDSCALRRVELDRSKLPNLRLIDVRIEKSSAANGEWPGASLRRVEIISARLTGLTIAEGDLSDVMLKDCKLDYLRIANSRLRNLRFEGCALSEAVFHESNLENVAIQGCDLRNADLTRAKLTDVNLSGSRIEGLKVDAAQLPALTIDPAQAMVIVQMLGAKIA